MRGTTNRIAFLGHINGGFQMHNPLSGVRIGFGFFRRFGMFDQSRGFPRARLSRQLLALNAAQSSQDLNLPGWYLHALKGELAGHCSIKVSGNWRLTFTFAGEDAVLVDYQDYH